MFFESTVQITYLNVRLAYDLTVQLHLDLDDSMHGRVCRPDVEEHGLGLGFSRLGDGTSSLESVLRTDPGLSPVDGVIFSERMSLKLRVHQNAFHVGMATKLDSEHIVDLPLVPVG